MANWWETNPDFTGGTVVPGPTAAPDAPPASSQAAPQTPPLVPGGWWENHPDLAGGGTPVPPDQVPMRPPPPEPPQSWQDQVRTFGKGMGTAVLEGVGGLAGLPHTIAGLGDKAMDYMIGNAGQPEVPGDAPATYTPGQPGWLTRHTQPPEDINSGIFGTISAANQATGGQPVEPYHATDLLPRMGQEALRNVIPGLLGGPEGAAGRTIGSMAGGAGGEGAASAYQYFNPNDPRGALIARLIGGLGAGIVGGSTGNMLAGKVSGDLNPIAQAYDRLGIDPLAGDATGYRLLQQAQAAGAPFPGGGRILRQMDNSLGQFADAVEGTAAPLAPARTPIQAGTALQGQSEDWLNRFRADSRQAWNNVDMHIPATTPTPVTNYAQTLMAVRNQMPAAPATGQALQPALTRNLADSLIHDIQAGPLDWQSVSGIRTRIGEMLSEPNLIGDTSYTDLRRIYGALSDDMQATAQARGINASRAFNNASTLTREGHDFIDNHLSNWYAPRNGIKPGQAVDAAFGDDGEALTAMRAQMPQAADQLAAWKLRDMALANPGQQDASLLRASPATFLTGAAKMTPETYDALFGHDAALAQRVQDLRDVSGAMRNTEHTYRNTSGTTSSGAMYGALAGLAGALPAGGTVLATGGGLPHAIATAVGTAAAPFLPGYIAGQLTARPGLARMMARQNPGYNLGYNAAGALAPTQRAVQGLLGPGF